MGTEPGNKEFRPAETENQREKTAFWSVAGWETLEKSIKRCYIKEFYCNKPEMKHKDEETCTVQLTVTTPSPELSAIISYTATACMEDYINVMNQANTIGIGALNKGGEIAQSPSNRHPLRNMAIAAVIGFVVVCAILICFFVFDDKIKVPDDIQKHLKLNVLGEIPEIEEA